MDINLKIKNVKSNVSTIADAVSCLICGENVPLEKFEQSRVRFGLDIHSKVCDKCREAVLEMRKRLDTDIDKQTLWDKAGTSNHITRADVNVRTPKDNSGTQELTEGFCEKET